MTGGGRLVMALAFFPFFLAAAVFAADDAKPPVAEIKPMADIFHGTTVIDNYRWLENAESAETKKWVAEENAYTRVVLDPLAGRESIHKRLTELLVIGSVTPPVIAGKHYFYTRREGIPIIAFSAFVEKLEEARGSQGLFRAFVPKPVEPSKLVSLVKRLVPASISHVG